MFRHEIEGNFQTKQGSHVKSCIMGELSLNIAPCTKAPQRKENNECIIKATVLCAQCEDNLKRSYFWHTYHAK